MKKRTITEKRKKKTMNLYLEKKKIIRYMKERIIHKKRRNKLGRKRVNYIYHENFVLIAITIGNYHWNKF